MPGYDGKYGVILDRHLDEYSDRWALIGLHDSREEAASHDAWNGQPPELVPRAGWAAHREEDTTVLDLSTREAEPAGVFRLERRDDG